MRGSWRVARCIVACCGECDAVVAAAPGFGPGLPGGRFTAERTYYLRANVAELLPFRHPQSDEPVDREA